MEKNGQDVSSQVACSACKGPLEGYPKYFAGNSSPLCDKCFAKGDKGRIMGIGHSVPGGTWPQ